MLTVRVEGPFDLRLSLRAAASFLPLSEVTDVLTTALHLNGADNLITVSQPPGRSVLVQASSLRPLEQAPLREIASWLVWSDLNVRPFYQLAIEHSIMRPIVKSLRGLKPLRPPTIFEMAIIAITEQQLSLAAAFHIRMRLVNRFGTKLGRTTCFPSAESLAAAPLTKLRSCGLSGRKAEYVKDLARYVAKGVVDLEKLKHESDKRIRAELLAIRGFGSWSVEYMLLRGFGRPDALPSGDTGLRRTIGHYFAHGQRLTPAQLRRKLAPFKPFRGLAAYYLAVHWRLCRQSNSAPDVR